MGIFAVFMTVLVASFSVISHFSAETNQHIVTAVVEEPSFPSHTDSASKKETAVSPIIEASLSPKTSSLSEQPFAVKGVSQPISPIVLAVTVTPNMVRKKTPTETPILTQTTTMTPSAPSPTPNSASATQIDGWFEQFSGEFGVDSALLRKIAVCESGYNTNARSKHGYGGMFQFSISAWTSTRTHMGLDTNPDLRFNAEEAIRTAAFKISKNGTGAWPVCGAR